MTNVPSEANQTEADGRLTRAVRTAASLARRLATGVAVLGGLSAGAGGVLWALLWWPPALRPLSLIGAVLTLVMLLSPAGVLGLFWIGLHDLLALPDRLAERTERTMEQSAAAAQSVMTNEALSLPGRTWQVLKQIWALRSVLLENRALLVRYGALVRFVHPAFLLLVVAAAGATLVLLPLAVGGGLLAYLWA